MKADRLKWDERYRQGGPASSAEPVAFLTECEPLLPRGKVLDIACGAGRNALYLAERGFCVFGVDISPVGTSILRRRARERGVRVHAFVADLEAHTLPAGQFDIILNFYYLQRDLIAQVREGVKPGGYVVFETHTIDKPNIRRKYQLGRNELLHWFIDWEVQVYREGTEVDKGVASLLARRPAAGLA